MPEQTTSPTSFERRLAQLKTLRDEIRVKLHLAEMDAKDRWQELEPEIERAITKLEGATERALDQLVQKVEKFNKSLKH
jgi:hypothetical protein